MANDTAPAAPVTLGVMNSNPETGLPGEVIGLAAAKSQDPAPAQAKPKAVKPTAKKEPVIDSEGLEVGEPIIYWDIPQKAYGTRMVFGWKTDLVPRIGMVVEVHPAGVVHIAWLTPGAMLHNAIEQAAVPTVGKFTRMRHS